MFTAITRHARVYETGTVVRGDIGSRFVRRKPRSAASLLSADLYARIKERVEVEEMPGITLKGIDHPVSAFVLKGFKPS